MPMERSNMTLCTKELVFIPNKIEKIEKKIRMDNADEKRVELHVHTKLSEMDGVSSIQEYIDVAGKIRASWYRYYRPPCRSGLSKSSTLCRKDQ